MKDKESYITLVIHTPQRAERLKVVLESHGIEVFIQDLNSVIPDFQGMAKQVKININDLSLSLKILESGDLVSSPSSFAEVENSGNTLLIPVDFSESSILAVKIGFYLAKKIGLEPLILHSYLAPQFSPSDFFENQVDPIELPQFEEIEQEIDFNKAASSQLSQFKSKIQKCIQLGEVTDIKFSTALFEGVPEQVIHEYCRDNKPALVVMATRGIDKKESELVGSVTAEVIDSCRVPIITIPDNYNAGGVDKLKRIVLFCTFTTFDLVTVRMLMRTFNYPTCNVWLVPVSDSPIINVKSKLDKLSNYLSETYPTVSFYPTRLGSGKFDDNMRKLLDDNNINMIIVPNKKSNAISRFFHPTLAHRILFERDIPLLVLPYQQPK